MPQGQALVGLVLRDSYTDPSSGRTVLRLAAANGQRLPDHQFGCVGAYSSHGFVKVGEPKAAGNGLCSVCAACFDSITCHTCNGGMSW